MTQVEFVRYGSTTRREIKIQIQIQTSTLGFLHSRRQTALLETFTNNLNPPWVPALAIPTGAGVKNTENPS